MDPTYETRETLTKRSDILGKLYERFWSQWGHEYLTALRESHARAKTGHMLTNKIKPGDVVLVHSDIKKRLMWDMAVVESLIIGNDGIARAANIRTKNGKTNRPITKLYPLEVNSDQIEEENVVETVQDDTEPDVNHPLKREAAKRARLRIRDLVQNDVV